MFRCCYQLVVFQLVVFQLVVFKRVLLSVILVRVFSFLFLTIVEELTNFHFQSFLFFLQLTPNKPILNRYFDHHVNDDWNKDIFLQTQYFLLKHEFYLYNPIFNILFFRLFKEVILLHYECMDICLTFSHLQWFWKN